MLQKVEMLFAEKLKNLDAWTFVFKRIIYIACFAGLCMIDQIIGSATGRIQYGLKNYTGIIIAIVILTAYKVKDFIKIPYLIWIIIFFIGRCFALDWGKANAGNYLEFQTNLWGIGIYGVLLIRMFYQFVIEKSRPHMKWSAFLIWLFMVGGMAVIRNDLAWPKALLGAFVCFYLTNFEEKDLNNLYSGIVEGIIVGFLMIQGQAWMYRPYDSEDFRYLGMYSHANMNALFYVCAYCAVLCKWYSMKLKKQRILFRVPFIILLGFIVGTTVFTGGRTALITIFVLTVIFLIFQMLSRSRRKLLELITDVAVIGVAAVVCFIPSYVFIRYIPALVDNPIYFEADSEEDKIQKGDSIDSKKYVELDEAIGGLFGRILWFVDNEKLGDIRDWKENLQPSIQVEAAEWSEEYYNPIVVNVALENSGVAIKVSWEPIDEVEGYIIYRSFEKDGIYEELTRTNETSYVDEIGATNTNVYYKVSTYIGEQISAQSSVLGIGTAALKTPEVSVDESGEYPVLSWEAVEGAEAYIIYRADTEDGTFSKLKEVKRGTSFTDDSLEDEVTGWYKVRAYYQKEDGYEYSLYSTIVHGTSNIWSPLDEEVYIEPGMDRRYPLLTGEDAKDPVKIRFSIYEYFMKRLSLVGQKNNPQGVWTSNNNFATHCHNLLLQIAYDFGIIIVIPFIIIILMLYNKVIFGLTERKSGSWYYRLFVTVGFASVFVVFGMLEIDWTYGQLPFTMFFIIQYLIYHKEPKRVRKQEDTIEVAESELEIIDLQ